METLWLDLKHGIRSLARAPGLTAIAVLTLALGIGANTAMFSVVHGVLLNPLPYPESHRLVRLTETIGRREVNVSYPNFLDWRARSHTLQEVATYNPFFSATLSGVERAELLPGAAAESPLFRLLGVQPVLGRIFTEEEERRGGPAVVLISHALWERNFGRDPQIIGRSIRLEMSPATVIGVLPPHFRLARADVWFPLGPVLNRNLLDRGNHPGFQAFGRMRPGATLEQVRDEMNAIAAGLEQDHPGSNKDVRVRVRPLLDSITGRVQPMLWVLLGTVSFVLLIACANVSNMLLARALGRSREVAVRAALGAGAGRLFRMFLVESLLLGALGGGGGLLLAWWGVDALLAAQPGVIPRAAEIGIQVPVLLYTFAVTLLCSVIFGTAPAWRAMHANLMDALKQGARSVGRAGGTRLRWTLVTAQVALSVVLLIGAGLMLRTLLALTSVDPGFRPEGLLAYTVHLPGQSYNEPEKVQSFVDRALADVRGVAGIESAAAIWPLSLEEIQWTAPVNIEENMRPDGQEPWVQAAVVTPGYFRVMRIPLRAGRGFQESDTLRSPHVALVNQEFARHFYGGANPIGKRVRRMAQVGEYTWTEIVGVVGNTLRGSLADRPAPEIYWPYAQLPQVAPVLIVRAAADPAGFTSALHDRVAAMDSDAVVQRPRLMTEILARTVADRTFFQFTLGAFAALALILTVVGIYGAAAYLVTQRTQEVGVRIALGALPRDVLGLILRQGLVPVGIGIALGVGGALLLTDFIASRLYGVRATDPVTFAAVAVLLTLVSLSACLVPARRATRVDPIVALKYE